MKAFYDIHTNWETYCEVNITCGYTISTPQNVPPNASETAGGSDPPARGPVFTTD